MSPIAFLVMTFLAYLALRDRLGTYITLATENNRENLPAQPVGSKEKTPNKSSSDISKGLFGDWANMLSDPQKAMINLGGMLDI